MIYRSLIDTAAPAYERISRAVFGRKTVRLTTDECVAISLLKRFTPEQIALEKGFEL